MKPGVAVAYGLFNAQQRGTLIVDPATRSTRAWSLGTALPARTSPSMYVKPSISLIPAPPGSDDALRLVPVSKFSLEESLEFLKPDELLEVTPSSIRIRKRILNHDLRMKATRAAKYRLSKNS